MLNMYRSIKYSRTALSHHHFTTVEFQDILQKNESGIVNFRAIFKLSGI